LNASHAPVTIFATFVPSQGHEADVEAVLQAVIAPTRAETGCLRFDLYRSTTSPTTFRLFEIFANPEAIAYHRTTAHYQRFRQAIEPLLKTPPIATTVEGIDVA
jgi:quinol monooxygenase YgiN